MTLLIFISLNLWFYVLWEKRLFHDTLNFYACCFSLNLEVTWSLNVFHLWYIGKRCQQRKNISIIWYLKRNNCIVKNIFIVCLLLPRGMTTSWIPLINIFIVPFFGHLFIWIYLNMYKILTGSFFWQALIPLNKFIKLHVWLLLIPVWCLICWARPENVTLVNV